MKLAVVVLIVLGLFAAGSAALLMRMLTMPPRSQSAVKIAEPEIEVLVATRDIEAMSVVNAQSVESKTIPKSQVPAQALTSSVQVIGRIVTTGVLKGEAFRESDFARDGAPVHLAAALPPGKRAVCVQLRDWSAMSGLLYPGSVVDVLVSLNIATPDGLGGDSITTTMLQGLQVLAVGSQSVASEKEYADKSPGALSGRGQYQHRMVTLLVDPKQAELLQLAMEHGSISLAMRNPMDRAQTSRRFTRMADLSGDSFAGPRFPGLAQTPNQENSGDALADSQGSDAAGAGAAAPAKPPEKKDPAPRPLWEMLIIRGDTSDMQTFPLPNEDVNQAENAQVENEG